VWATNTGAEIIELCIKREGGIENVGMDFGDTVKTGEITR
jgi:hypothetical protein